MNSIERHFQSVDRGEQSRAYEHLDPLDRFAAVTRERASYRDTARRLSLYRPGDPAGFLRIDRRLNEKLIINSNIVLQVTNIDYEKKEATVGIQFPDLEESTYKLGIDSQITIGEVVNISCRHISPTRVDFSISAPDDVSVHREEIQRQIDEQLSKQNINIETTPLLTTIQCNPPGAQVS